MTGRHVERSCSNTTSEPLHARSAGPYFRRIVCLTSSEVRTHLTGRSVADNKKGSRTLGESPMAREAPDARLRLMTDVSAGDIPDTYVIRGGLLIDGSGADATEADIVVSGGRIDDVLPAGTCGLSGRAVVDAAGCVVAPGFIDAHSHADNAFLRDEDDLTKVMQGVTTEVVGNCGFSLAPLTTGPGRAANEDAMRKTFPVATTSWTSTADLYALHDERGSVINQCPLVGHNALRLAVLGGSGRRPTPDELGEMRGLLEDALSEGAFGVSSGVMFGAGV